MVQEKKNKQPFPYKNQPVNIILNKTKQQQQKKNSKQIYNKKTNTYGYICIFMFGISMFGIKQPKSKSLKIGTWTYQFPGFYVAR